MKESETRRIGAGAFKLRNPGESAAQELSLPPGEKIAGRIEWVAASEARRTEPEQAALPRATEASAGGASATSSAEAPKARRTEPEKSAAPVPPASPGAFRVSVGYATAAAEEICGDTAISSGLPNGSLALILSDGMGKGIRAAAMSRSVANRLRKNLKAGTSPQKLARWILEETVKQYGERERDDLTVAVVKVLDR